MISFEEHTQLTKNFGFLALFQATLIFYTKNYCNGFKCFKAYCDQNTTYIFHNKNLQSLSHI